MYLAFFIGNLSTSALHGGSPLIKKRPDISIFQRSFENHSKICFHTSVRDCEDVAEMSCRLYMVVSLVFLQRKIAGPISARWILRPHGRSNIYICEELWIDGAETMYFKWFGGQQREESTNKIVFCEFPGLWREPFEGAYSTFLLVP